MGVPRFYTIVETAEIFRVSRRTFEDFVAVHPFYRQIGKRKLFTEADIAALAEKMECQSKSLVSPEVQTSTSVGRSEASKFTRLAALQAQKRRKPSARKGNGKSSKVVFLAPPPPRP